MKRILLGCFMAALFLGCKKNKFETKPKLVIKSVTPSVVPPEGNAVITFEFFDKEGDVDSVITMVRRRINQRPATVSTRTTFPFIVPQFPDRSSGEIEVFLDKDNHLKMSQPPPANPNSPTGRESDTLLLKFVIADKGKNVSDTVSTQIVVMRR
jgi:hypothetical protein